ncbi:MAG: hypothetical protein JWR50_2610 [Mucilaginibacter sp.]|nr:hypothetical protein [Mucilaginibacter sp.]
MRLESHCLVVKLVYVPRERACIFWLGGKGKDAHQMGIDNELAAAFFKSNLKFSEVTVNDFINNLRAFFEQGARGILGCDLEELKKLEEFTSERARVYTKNLLKEQKLRDVNKAWDEKNYGSFIKLLDELQGETLLGSYKIK